MIQNTSPPIEPVRHGDNHAKPAQRVPGPTICLLGVNVTVGNLGVRALTHALIEQLLEAYPHASINLVFGDRQPGVLRVAGGQSPRPVRVVNFRLSPKSRPTEHLLAILALAMCYRLLPISAIRRWIRRVSPMLDVLSEADLIGDIRGGDSFSDLYGVKRLVVGTLPIAITRLVGQRYVLLPQTYGPYQTLIGRMIARWTIRGADQVYSRDEEGLGTVRELLGPGGPEGGIVQPCPDVALALAPRQARREQIDPPLPPRSSAQLIGLNVSGLLYIGGYTRDNMFGLRSNYQNMVYKLAVTILERPGTHLLLVPHVLGRESETDQAACESLFEELTALFQGRVHVVRGNYDQSEIKHIIGRCDFLYGSRMHACIAALSQGIPAVGIAYSKKFLGVFATVGVADMVLDARELEASDLVEQCMDRLDRAEEIRRRLGEEIPRAQATIREAIRSILPPGADTIEHARRGEGERGDRGGRQRQTEFTPGRSGEAGAMMGRSVETLRDVVEWGQCIGCGVCHYYCRHGGIRLVNVVDEGIRPQFELPDCANCTECLEVCPGHHVDGEMLTREMGEVGQAPGAEEFGVALEIWEGWAADPEIRHRASSGGLLTALSLYCLEREGMGGVLHTGSDEEQPWLNRTVLSSTRMELVERAGSRYAPASPCDGLGRIEQSERPCVFIGKPCDTAAVMKARRGRPELDEKLGVVLAFFCAGTPSTGATLELLSEMGITPERLKRLRYRGEGWPGGFKAAVKGREDEPFVSYHESWGKLARRRPFRCHLCPDGLGRLSDLACGDAWEKYSDDGDAGRSLVLVRTERGREVLHAAMAAGYVELKRVGAREVLEAQVNLLGRRREIYGRLTGMRMLGMPIPRLDGFGLRNSWNTLGARSRMRTVIGTIRRCLQRGWWKRRTMITGTRRRPAGSSTETMASDNMGQADG